MIIINTNAPPSIDVICFPFECYGIAFGAQGLLTTNFRKKCALFIIQLEKKTTAVEEKEEDTTISIRFGTCYMHSV